MKSLQDTHRLPTTLIIPGSRHVSQHTAFSPGMPKLGRHFPHLHFLCLTFTIPGFRHVLQQTAFSPGLPNVGILPQMHFLFMTSSISSVRQSLQNVGFSPGMPNVGRHFPHLHLLSTTSSISSVRQSLQHVGLSPGMPNIGIDFPHLHFRRLCLTSSHFLSLCNLQTIGFPHSFPYDARDLHRHPCSSLYWHRRVIRTHSSSFLYIYQGLKR